MLGENGNSRNWHDYRNYADRVTIGITPVEHPMYLDDAKETWVIQSDGAAWTQDWLVQEVQAIARSGRGSEDSHVLEVNEQHVSWGAAGATYEIWLLIAQWAAAGAVGGAAWGATKKLAAQLRTKLAERMPGPENNPLTEDELEHRTRWAITARYKITDGLTLESIELAPPSQGSTVFRGPDGCKYECDLATEGTLVTITRIKRTTSSEISTQPLQPDQLDAGRLDSNYREVD